MIIRPTIVFINPGDDIQATIDALPAEGGIVQLNAGVYTITDTIVFPDDRPVWLRGEGMTEVNTNTGTVIHNASGLADADSILLQWHNQRVSDLGLTFVSTMASGAGIGTESVGIRVRPAATIAERNAEGIMLDNLWIEAAPSWGIYLEGNEVAADGRLSFDARLSRVHIRGNWNDGGMCLGEGCQNVQLDQCVLTSFNVNHGVGLQLLGCTTVSVNQCTIQEIGSTTSPNNVGYMVRLGSNTSGGQNVNISFNQCHFEDGITTAALLHKHFVLLDGICDCVSFNECYFIRTNNGVRPRAIDASGARIRNLSVRGCLVCSVTAVPYAFDDDIVLGATCYGAMIDGGCSVAYVAGVWETTPLVVQDNGVNTLIRRPTWTDPLNTSLAATVIPGWLSIPKATAAQLSAAVSGRDGTLAWDSTNQVLKVCPGGASWREVIAGPVFYEDGMVALDDEAVTY